MSRKRTRTRGRYIFRASITRNGRKIRASDYGLKAFRIWIDE